jgi:hypothetical protein
MLSPIEKLEACASEVLAMLSNGWKDLYDRTLASAAETVQQLVLIILKRALEPARESHGDRTDRVIAAPEKGPLGSRLAALVGLGVGVGGGLGRRVRVGGTLGPCVRAGSALGRGFRRGGALRRGFRDDGALGAGFRSGGALRRGFPSTGALGRGF